MCVCVCTHDRLCVETVIVLRATRCSALRMFLPAYVPYKQHPKIQVDMHHTWNFTHIQIFTKPSSHIRHGDIALPVRAYMCECIDYTHTHTHSHTHLDDVRKVLHYGDIALPASVLQTKTATQEWLTYAKEFRHQEFTYRYAHTH